MNQTAAAKPRIQFIDLAKGVCITMVVLFHCGVITPSTPALSSLRMPLYFLLSGLFFKSYGGIGGLALKKTNKILVPCLFFALAAELVLYPVYTLWHAGHGVFDFAALYAQLSQSWPHNAVLWFLVCLFETTMLFAVIKALLRGWAPIAAAVAACGLTGVYLSMHHIALPMFIDSALTALPFFYMGYVIKRTPLLYPGRHDGRAWIWGALLVAGAVVISLVWGNPHIDMRSNAIIGHPALCYISSSLIVPGILLICKSIGHLPWISYLGRYSVIVLGTHIVFRNITSMLLGNGQTYLTHVVVALATLGLGTLVIRPIVHYLPRFCAQADLLPEGKIMAGARRSGMRIAQLLHLHAVMR